MVARLRSKASLAFTKYNLCSATEMPYRKRLRTAEEVGDEGVLRHVKRSKNQRAAYDQFYDPAPLINYFNNVEVSLPSMPLLRLRSALLVALRCTTLARSTDCACLLPSLFFTGDQFFIRFLDKNANNRLMSLGKRTLSLFIEYLKRTITHPCPFLFRHIHHPQKALSADALANIVGTVMTDVGLDRTVFKPHSMRWALATEYLRKGAPHAVTRQRGGWCTDRAFEQHYARTHQTADWEGYLLGVTSATSSTS